MSDTLLNPNGKTLELLLKNLDELHKLNLKSISESSEVSKSVTDNYIITLIKIDYLSGNDALMELRSGFNL